MKPDKLLSRSALDRRGWSKRHIEALGVPDAVLTLPDGSQSPRWRGSRLRPLEKADPELAAQVAYHATAKIARHAAVAVRKERLRHLPTHHKEALASGSRVHLQERNGQQVGCTGIVARFGTLKSDAAAKTVLLCNVDDVDTGARLTDHVWIEAGPWSASLKLGMLIVFDARATRYTKGYQGMNMVFGDPLRTDWNLTNPTKVIVIDLPDDATEEEPVPLDA